MSEVTLPKEWKLIPLSAATELIRGVTYKKNQSSVTTEPGYLPILRANNIQKGHLVLNDLVYVPKELISYKQKIAAGDIVIAMSSGSKSVVGKAARSETDIDAGFGAFCGVLRPLNSINAKYISFFTKSAEYRNSVSRLSAGANINNLKPSHFDEIELPIPPLAEQKAIADKLDTLLAQVESSKARLERIPQILKRFRQSVLSAAVSGKLTEEWRGQSEYTGTKLGFEIPKSWKLLTIEDFAEVKGGKRLPKGEELVEENTGFKYIRAGQLKNGTIISGNEARNKQLYITPTAHQKINRYIISKGDAYLTIVGASIGDAGVAPQEFDGANLTENAAKLCGFKQPISSDYMGYWLRSQYIQDLIRLEIKSGAQGKLALKRIKTLPFPKVSIEEQIEIVNRVEQLFAYADTIEQQVQNALARVNNLTQSILAKAFRGELTEQWRKDNPDLISCDNSAETLLAKIQAEREAMRPKKKTRARKMTA